MSHHVWLRLGKEAPGETARELEAAFPGVRFSFEPDKADYGDIDVVFSRNRLPDETTAALPALKWIHTTYGGGLSFLTDHVKGRGIKVTCSRGVQAEPLSEFTEACVLAMTKRLLLLGNLKRERKWDESIGLDTLSGKVALLLGLGAVGSAVARRLHKQGMRVRAIRRNTANVPDYVESVSALDSLPGLLPDADFVVIGLPPIDGLNGLFDEDRLRSMKRGSCLINLVSRGVVRDAALARALKEGWIGGAVCNVFEENPLGETSELWTAPNLIISPGVAQTDPLRWQKLRKVFTDNLQRYLGGKPMENVVDGSAAY